MYRTATIAAYDVLGNVFITASVRTYEADGHSFDSSEFRCAATVESVGEEMTEDWLRDSLIALAETL